MERDAVDAILVQWQRERPDLDATPMGAIGRIARVKKHLDDSIQQTIAPYGLNLGEFDVLATLRRSGPPYQLSPTSLFQALMISSGTITHRIDKLERAALVVRVRDPRDRRSAAVALTPMGLQIADAAVEAHVANAHNLLSVLEVAECDALKRALRKLVLSFERE